MCKNNKNKTCQENVLRARSTANLDFFLVSTLKLKLSSMFTSIREMPNSHKKNNKDTFPSYFISINKRESMQHILVQIYSTKIVR